MVAKNKEVTGIFIKLIHFINWSRSEEKNKTVHEIDLCKKRV